MKRKTRKTRQTIVYSITFTAAIMGFLGFAFTLAGIGMGMYGLLGGFIRAVITAAAAVFFGYLAIEMDKRMIRDARRHLKTVTVQTVRIDTVAVMNQLEKKPIRKVVM